MTNRPILSILLGTVDRLPLLQQCIDALMKQLRPEFEVFVIDAGSSDGTQSYVRSLQHPQIQLVEDGKKLGQARSFNRILRRLDSRYVVWISDDNLLAPDALADCVHILETTPRMGMVGLKVKDVNGPFADAAYIGGIWKSGILNINQGMVRLSVMRQIGYFDEEFGSYGIDADLTTRILLAGHQVCLTKNIAIYHQRMHSDHPGAFTAGERSRQQMRAQKLYEKKYGALCQQFSRSVKVKLAKRMISTFHTIRRTPRNIYYNVIVRFFRFCIKALRAAVRRTYRLMQAIYRRVVMIKRAIVRRIILSKRSIVRSAIIFTRAVIRIFMRTVVRGTIVLKRKSVRLATVATRKSVRLATIITRKVLRATYSGTPTPAKGSTFETSEIIRPSYQNPPPPGSPLGWLRRRDFYNIYLTGWISPFDLLKSKGKKFYLVQELDPKLVELAKSKASRKKGEHERNLVVPNKKTEQAKSHATNETPHRSLEAGLI